MEEGIEGRGLYPRYGGCFSLDTLTIALVCIFCSNLSHSQVNQRNSIIKEWKKIEFLQFFFLPKHNKKADGLSKEFSSNPKTKCTDVPKSFISTHPFSESFSKISQPPRQNQQNGKQRCLPPLPFKISVKDTSFHITLSSLGLYLSPECFLNFL